MYFVSMLREDRQPTDAELVGVRHAAARASLSEAAWGFAYPDLWRALLPIFRFEKDRGWAMEQAWRRNFAPDQVPTLGHWIEGVRQGWMPAVALNATVVESGSRFAFATFDPPPEHDASGRRTWDLSTVLNTYPRHDTDVPFRPGWVSSRVWMRSASGPWRRARRRSRVRGSCVGTITKVPSAPSRWIWSWSQ